MLVYGPTGRKVAYLSRPFVFHMAVDVLAKKFLAGQTETTEQSMSKASWNFRLWKHVVKLKSNFHYLQIYWCIFEAKWMEDKYRPCCNKSATPVPIQFIICFSRPHSITNRVYLNLRMRSCHIFSYVTKAEQQLTPHSSNTAMYTSFSKLVESVVTLKPRHINYISLWPR